MSVNKSLKARTPSGSIIENRVGEIRNYFSPVKDTISEEALLSEAGQTGDKLTSSEIIKRDGHNCVKNVKGASALRDRVLLSDSDGELDFSTPPATPARLNLRTSQKIETSVIANIPHQRDHQQQRYINMAGISTESNILANDTDPRTVAKQITNELEEIMDQSENEPPTMDVSTVHAMFKRLEASIVEKFNHLDRSCKNPDQQQSGDLEEINDRIEKLTISSKVMKEAVQHMWDESSATKERVSKLETNVNKRMIILSGLSVSEQKDVARREIDH